jgi:hypothetical protein
VLRPRHYSPITSTWKLSSKSVFQVNIQVFWYITPCRLVISYRRFDHGRTTMFQSTRRKIPESTATYPPLIFPIKSLNRLPDVSLIILGLTTERNTAHTGNISASVYSQNHPSFFIPRWTHKKLYTELWLYYYDYYKPLNHFYCCKHSTKRKSTFAKDGVKEVTVKQVSCVSAHCLQYCSLMSATMWQGSTCAYLIASTVERYIQTCIEWHLFISSNLVCRHFAFRVYI